MTHYRLKVIALAIVTVYFAISFVYFLNTDSTLKTESIMFKLFSRPYFLFEGIGFYLGFLGATIGIIVIGLIIWLAFYQILKLAFRNRLNEIK